MGRHTDNITAKAERLIADDRITQAGSLWTVEGDHGTYYVTVEGTGWDARTRCDCPAVGYCSHAQAVYNLIVRRGVESGELDPFQGLT